MKIWNNLSNSEKTESFNSYLQFLQNVQPNLTENFQKELSTKITKTSEESYRDYIILLLLDKGYTIKDGFSFFDAAGISLSQTDTFSIISEKLDISFDQLLAAMISPLNQPANGQPSLLQKEHEKVHQDANLLFQDIRLRMEVFVEVHDTVFQKQNPEKYVELLNSPITSLLSIKLSQNERITKALKRRLKK